MSTLKNVVVIKYQDTPTFPNLVTDYYHLHSEGCGKVMFSHLFVRSQGAGRGTPVPVLTGGGGGNGKGQSGAFSGTLILIINVFLATMFLSWIG